MDGFAPGAHWSGDGINGVVRLEPRLLLHLDLAHAGREIGMLEVIDADAAQHDG